NMIRRIARRMGSLVGVGTLLALAVAPGCSRFDGSSGASQAAEEEPAEDAACDDLADAPACDVSGCSDAEVDCVVALLDAVVADAPPGESVPLLDDGDDDAELQTSSAHSPRLHVLAGFGNDVRRFSKLWRALERALDVYERNGVRALAGPYHPGAVN